MVMPPPHITRRRH